MKVCSRVCNECPFSSNSLPGYLGPHATNDIIQMMNFEHPFSCHLHRDEETTYDDIKNGLVPVCRGFMVSASLSCKMFGGSLEFGSDLKRIQDQVKKDMIEKEGSILNKVDFIKYHKNNPNG